MTLNRYSIPEPFDDPDEPGMVHIPYRFLHEDELRSVERTPEQRAEFELQEAKKAGVKACGEHHAAIEEEENARIAVSKEGPSQKWDLYCRLWHEEAKLKLEEASLKFEEAIQKCVRADLNLQSIRRINEAHSTRALEEVANEVTGPEDMVKEEVIEEVEQVSIESTIIEPFEEDMVIEKEEVQLEKVVQEESHLVEPEYIDFIFAPDDFEKYTRARLLAFLPKIFSFSNRAQSWRYATPCQTHSRRGSPLGYKPEPTLYHDFTHVRGWSINDLKWPWQFKVNKIFEWRFGLGVSNQRRYSSLSVWK